MNEFTIYDTGTEILYVNNITGEGYNIVGNKVCDMCEKKFGVEDNEWNHYKNQIG